MYYALYLCSVFFEQEARERRLPACPKGVHTATTIKVYNVSATKMKNDRIRSAIITSSITDTCIRLHKHLIRIVHLDVTESRISPSVLKNMKEEDVDAWILTGELSSGCIIVTSYIGYNPGKLNSTICGSSCWIAKCEC